MAYGNKGGLQVSYAEHLLSDKICPKCKNKSVKWKMKESYWSEHDPKTFYEFGHFYCTACSWTSENHTYEWSPNDS